MAFRRWRRWAGILGGLALVPLVLWVLVVLVVPTDWARRRVVEQLESRSGRRVALGRVSVGLLGRVRLVNLEIGSPQDTSDPWLKADEIRLDFGLLRMLGGRCRPARVEADGVELRVLRRADGTLELADLFRPMPPRLGPDGRIPPDEARVDVGLRRAVVTVVDEPTRTRLRLEGVEGEGYAEGRTAVVEQIRGSLNGGEIRIAARIDRTASRLAALARLHADDVALDDSMKVLRYAVPVLAGASGALKGTLDADATFRGRGASWDALCRQLAGRGRVALERVSLDDTPLMAELSRFVDLSGRRIGSIHTDFVYKDRRVTTDHLTVNVGRIPINMIGWTDLDGRVDYQMRISGLDEHLPDQARRLLGELKVDVGALTSLTLRGTLDKMAVQVNGVPVDADRVRDRLARPADRVRLRPDDRERLRTLSRQLRDQFLR